MQAIKTNLRSNLHLTMILFFDRAIGVLDDRGPNEHANKGGDLPLARMIPDSD